MTQEPPKHLSRVRDMVHDVDVMVKATNQDLRRFQQEQDKLRDKVKLVRKENERLNEELGKYQKQMAGGDYVDLGKRLKLTSDALELSKKQVQMLQEERRSQLTTQECSERTIANMELELQKYRIQLLDADNQEEITQAVAMLEAKVNSQQKELRTQAETIKALHKHKQRDGEKLLQLTTQLRGQDQQLKEYEISLDGTRQLLDESTRREGIAMQKVHEAIALSDEAVRARRKAEQRAETSREEVHQLAGSIGGVMDEAANRVDMEISHFKKLLVAKDKSIADMKDKMRAEHKSVVHLLETRNNQLESKYKEAKKQNIKLEDEVRVASRRINELEQAANDFQSDKKTYEAEMEEHLQSYRKLKADYQTTLNDITQRFEAVIYKLKTDNAELVADNSLLRKGGAGDNFQPLPNSTNDNLQLSP